jgi:hypothetical protein
MSDRPCSLLIPHVRLRDTHGWIGTRPGCQACVEHHGDHYWIPYDEPPDLASESLRPGQAPRHTDTIPLPGGDHE